MARACEHTNLLSLLKNGDSASFEIIYDQYAGRLYEYVSRRVKVKEVSEEIVQEIFVSLWDKRQSLVITDSLEAYLFGAAKFKILSYIRSENVRKEYAAHFTSFLAMRSFQNPVEEIMDLKDLQHTIEVRISELPEKCQTAFRLSRIEHQPIPRIAEHMNISRRTVENYLSQALKHLRTSMGDWLMIFLLWFMG